MTKVEVKDQIDVPYIQYSINKQITTIWSIITRTYVNIASSCRVDQVTESLFLARAAAVIIILVGNGQNYSGIILVITTC